MKIKKNLKPRNKFSRSNKTLPDNIFSEGDDLEVIIVAEVNWKLTENVAIQQCGDLKVIMALLYDLTSY